MNTGDVPVLDELTLTVVVDNEVDPLSSIDHGVDQVPEVATALARGEPVRYHDGNPGICALDDLCVACHGYSVLVAARKGDETRYALFDVGPDGRLWLDNAARLGVDLAEIEAVFLSHWHADHSGGFPIVVGAIAAARAAAGRPAPVVDLHPDRPDQRGVQLPSGVVALLPSEPTLEEIQRAGGRIELHGDPHPLASLLVASGRIDRVTEYETGLPGHLTFRDDDVAADPLILDERLVVAHVRGRGLSVLSACSHAGIVNACLAASGLSGGMPIDVALGGYHLAGRAVESRIEPTVADLRDRVAPRLVAPGHCTGWRAKAALADAFAPGRYGPSVVGTRYHLTGEPR